MLNRKEGFTLAELLIVVAIIAVLTAVAIPVFSKQLEQSREAADLSKVRDAYAEVLYAANTDDRWAAYNERFIYQGDGIYEAIIPLGQKVNGWSMD